jgi:hypothetical protein
MQTASLVKNMANKIPRVIQGTVPTINLKKLFMSIISFLLQYTDNRFPSYVSGLSFIV